MRERERARLNERGKSFSKSGNRRYFPFSQGRLRNYEERLDDINPRLDSLSFGGKGEFQPRTIRFSGGLLVESEVKQPRYKVTSFSVMIHALQCVKLFEMYCLG